ncbi:hypothetical protein MPSEU_000926000 [Mayamaea pseudoterrestris]|nr:hypothetical protein MPSEU_000926000 [Mayamaea pseudoterrestris]
MSDNLQSSRDQQIWNISQSPLDDDDHAHDNELFATTDLYMHESVAPIINASGGGSSDDSFQLQHLRQRRSNNMEGSSVSSRHAPGPSTPTISSTSNSSITGCNESSSVPQVDEDDSKLRRALSPLDRGMRRVKRWVRSKSPQVSSMNANTRSHTLSPRLQGRRRRNNDANVTLQQSTDALQQPDVFASILEDDGLLELNRARTRSESDVVRFRSSTSRILRPRFSTEDAAAADSTGSSDSSNLYALPSSTTIPASTAAATTQLSSSAAAALYTSNDDPFLTGGLHNNLHQDTAFRDAGISPALYDSAGQPLQHFATADTLSPPVPMPLSPAAAPMFESMNNNNSQQPDRSQQQQPLPLNQSSEREARRRWMRINHCFQVVIAVVALIFSLLIFCILVSWAVWVIIFFFSLDLPCDLPLRGYFWLATIQLFVDVFRSDILRYCLGWNASSGNRIPCRIVVYNVCYLIYAALVLRLGVMTIYMDLGATCRSTAPELFRASGAFVTLSLAAWATIIFGYVCPMLVAAAMLTWNGYNPSSHPASGEAGAAHAVLPSVYATSGAPSGFIEQLPIMSWAELQARFPRDRECCICMDAFAQDDCIVKTACDHVFHKSCCKEWLRQARTCPVCRTDIPSASEFEPESGPMPHESQGRIPVGPTGRPISGMIRMFSRSENDTASGPRSHLPAAATSPVPFEIEMVEEGRSPR